MAAWCSIEVIRIQTCLKQPLKIGVWCWGFVTIRNMRLTATAWVFPNFSSLEIFLTRAEVVWDQCHIVDSGSRSELIAALRSDKGIFCYVNPLLVLIFLLSLPAVMAIRWAYAGRVDILKPELRVESFSICWAPWPLVDLLTAPAIVIERCGLDRLQMETHSLRFFDDPL